MRVVMLERRITHAEAVIDRQSDETAGPPSIVASPGEWPAADRAAFDGADAAARADAIERQTGRRPGPRTLVIVVADRTDSPQ